MRFHWWWLILPSFVVALAAMTISLVIAGRSGEAAIDRQQAAIARSAADYFVGFAREEGVNELIKALDRHEAVGSPDGFRYALVSKDGDILAGADVIGALDPPNSGWRTIREPDRTPSRQWRVLSRPLNNNLTLIVAEDLSARRAFDTAMFRGMIAGLLLTAVAVGAAGVALNALLLQRAQAIARTADQFAAGDLSARAPVGVRRDVFDHLGGSVNAMLERIEELMTGLRTVTDSLTHDLRSPLMRLQVALGRAQAAPDEEARNAAIADARAEADRTLSTISALMDIARAEAGLSREMMTEVDLAALAGEMAELFEPVLEDAGQTLALQTPDRPAPGRVHELLLRQALGNLLHNASVHAGAGASVLLSLAIEEGLARFVVADSGHGVPEDQLGRVQERFVRLDAARSRPGSGVGLALVVACAKLHGGRLILQDNRPGLRAVLELPLD